MDDWPLFSVAAWNLVVLLNLLTVPVALGADALVVLHRLALALLLLMMKKMMLQALMMLLMVGIGVQLLLLL